MSFLHRRGFHALFACAILGGLANTSASAQGGFPERPVKLIVPFAPGGSSDSATRILAEQLGKRWGQPVVVDNKGGAAGVIGADMVAKATMLMRLGGYDEPQPLIDAFLAMPKANAPLPSLMLGTVRA